MDGANGGLGSEQVKSIKYLRVIGLLIFLWVSLYLAIGGACDSGKRLVYVF